jgi:hypothetical protein
MSANKMRLTQLSDRINKFIILIYRLIRFDNQFISYYYFYCQFLFCSFFEWHPSITNRSGPAGFQAKIRFIRFPDWIFKISPVTGWIYLEPDPVC